MRLNHYLLLIAFLSILFGLQAQQVTISPAPQTVSWGEKAFNNSTTFSITGETTADKDAVNLLKSQLSTTASGTVEILIGEKGSTAVAAVDAKIPTKKQGYYLEIQPSKVYVAGTDSAGTYYGVQTLLQILASPEVMQVAVTDFPLVEERGIVEGFYGNFFSQEDRKSQFRFYGKTKLNTYIYGPKDDPYHGFGDQWRDPYPTEQANEMKELIEVAHENKVKFVWAVHPGNNIFWDDNDGDGIVDDFVACKNKFEAMYQLGVRSFAVFFDDISGIGADARNQAKMMNYLTEEFVNKKPDVDPLILCPTQYNQAWSGGDYLTTLGTQMDESVRIMWTGQSVVRMIDKATMNWINSRIKRKAYIWLNYPVTDYVIDHLLMGPFYGNDTDIDHMLSGFVANPMEYAEASKVALFSTAEYAWNMKDYEPNASWHRAMRFLMPDNYDAFKIFCENNIDLGPTYHGLRRDNESAPFKAVAEPFMTSYLKGEYNNAQADALDVVFRSFRSSSEELLASTGNPEMITEIKPWVEVFDFIAQKGEIMVEMFKNIQNEEPETFIVNYLKLDSIDKVKDQIRARDFPGSIKSPYPKPANEVVVPYLKKFLNALVTDYRGKFDYKTDIFPQMVLENGSYFIKFNGKYLTNKRGSSNPTFETELDNMNPERQQWQITLDAETGRYSIINAFDSRYLNELGNFTANATTNPFEAAWHTYTIYRLNGKYAIQNGGSAGTKMWTANNTRISIGSADEATHNTYIFEIVSIADETAEYPMIYPEESYYVKSDDLYLTNNNPRRSGGTPTFKDFIEDNSNNTQLWKFVIDSKSNRYKMTSAADSRYVNELGVFGTNPYYDSWNTYLMSERGGKYSIRNAGDAGKDFWGIANENNALRIIKSDLGFDESFLFELVPFGNYTSTDRLLSKRGSIQQLPNNIYLLSDYDVESMRLFL